MLIPFLRSKKAPTPTGEHQMTWDELEKSGLPHGTKAVVNVAGQNVLDPLSPWTAKFQQLVSLKTFFFNP